MCARACVRHSCTLLQHAAMLSQLPRNSNSKLQQATVGCREVGGTFTFQQDPADAVQGEKHVLIDEHDVRVQNRRALVPSLLPPRLSRCASRSIPGSLEQLRGPTTSFFGFGERSELCHRRKMLWLAALPVCVCARVQLCVFLVTVGARASETTPTRLDILRTLTNHGACMEHTRDLLHALEEYITTCSNR